MAPITPGNALIFLNAAITSVALLPSGHWINRGAKLCKAYVTRLIARIAVAFPMSNLVHTDLKALICFNPFSSNYEKSRQYLLQSNLYESGVAIIHRAISNCFCPEIGFLPANDLVEFKSGPINLKMKSKVVGSNLFQT